MNSFKFELGIEVKEIVTGFTGIIMGRSQYLTGCNQYGLLSRQLSKENTPEKWVWFDENRLQATGEKIELPKIEDPGFDGNHPNKY
jgi:hypothetical protein